MSPLPMDEKVSVAPLRERFEQLHEDEGLTLNELAIRCEWTTHGGKCGDTSRIERLFGYREWAATRKNGRVYPKYPSGETISYASAVRLADALGMDPFEAGL